MSHETANETADADTDSDAMADEPTADQRSQEGNEEGNEEGNDMSNTLSDTPAGEGEVSASNAASNSAAPAPAPRLSPVESMEVRIDFEVGRVTLPVSTLANVAAGSVIEMPGVSLDRVVAKSGGHAFAFGEFVELGGRVGFRILRLAETKEKR